MKTLPNGYFAHVINSSDLANGLRKSKRNPRNVNSLVTCNGAVGKDNVLQALEEFSRLDTSSITDSFPYPQLFVFTNFILICDETHIYEWFADALVLKITVLAGSTWQALDFHDYIYMSNSKVSVIRNIETGTYELSSLPAATAMCNFNGQIILGSPDEVYS